MYGTSLMTLAPLHSFLRDLRKSFPPLKMFNPPFHQNQVICKFHRSKQKEPNNLKSITSRSARWQIRCSRFHFVSFYSKFYLHSTTTHSSNNCNLFLRYNSHDYITSASHICRRANGGAHKCESTDLQNLKFLDSATWACSNLRHVSVTFRLICTSLRHQMSARSLEAFVHECKKARTDGGSNKTTSAARKQCCTQFSENQLIALLGIWMCQRLCKKCIIKFIALYITMPSPKAPEACAEAACA